MRISDWSSDVCSSDLHANLRAHALAKLLQRLDAGHQSAGLGIRRGIAAIGRQPAGELPHVDISRILRQLAALADAGTVVVPQIAEPFDVGDRKSTRLNSSH